MFDNIHQETHGLPDDAPVVDCMSPFDDEGDADTDESYEYWFFFNEDGTVDSGVYLLEKNSCGWLKLDLARRDNYEE